MDGGGGGGGSSGDADNADNYRTDPAGCVYLALVDNLGAEQVRALIERYASEGGQLRTRDACAARRRAAVDFSAGCCGARPLAYATAYGRGEVVGVLLEAGADVSAAFGPRCSALALAIHFEQIDALRALIRSGKHDANEKLRYGPTTRVEADDDDNEPSASCHPLHLAVFPPKSTRNVGIRPPPCLRAVEVLVREFGADIEGRTHEGGTPLHFLALAGMCGHDTKPALDLLLSLGADIEARSNTGSTPLMWAVSDSPDLVTQLMARGASPDATDAAGATPLMHVCCDMEAANPRRSIEILMRASSPATRRAVSVRGASALRGLIAGPHEDEPWCEKVIAMLLLDGTPVAPDLAPYALWYAAERGARLGPRAAARALEPPPWQGQDALVGLALDMKEVREVEEGVRARQARVAELERALAEQGGEEGGGEESGGGGRGGG